MHILPFVLSPIHTSIRPNYAVHYQRIQPITALWTEMDPIMQREQDKLMLGVEDAQTTARGMEEDVNRLLRESGLAAPE